MRFRCCDLCFVWVIIGLALALCAQPAIALPFSETLTSGLEFFNAEEAVDGTGTNNLGGAGGDTLYLGGSADVKIFMKIPVGLSVTNATLSTGGDIYCQHVAQPPAAAYAELSVGNRDRRASGRVY